MKKKTPLWLRSLISYFLRGLLFVAPLFITVYALYLFFQWADNLIHGIFPALFPGAGLLILLITITLVGVLTKLFIFRAVLNWLDHLFGRTPITKLIYTSIKELFSAFMGNKKTFNQPVMVLLFKEAGIQKLGFITKDNLSKIGISNMMAVYFPHSYNFSGNLYLVPSENITPIHDWSATDAMKFIVSGGVTEIKSESEGERM